jgi:endogenous inhibitor of DNA gyrase (YacG/DUF329 family)
MIQEEPHDATSTSATAHHGQPKTALPAGGRPDLMDWVTELLNTCGSQGTRSAENELYPFGTDARIPATSREVRKYIRVRVPRHSRYIFDAADVPACWSCCRGLMGIAVWPFHDGGPVCERCLYEKSWTEAIKMYRNGELDQCEALCGRYVLDLRVRGQARLVCSSECRRRMDAETKRMERRAARRELPLIACSECGADLEATRSDARYCSARCRVRAHRSRRRAAASR